ncbi:MAG: hypothetical protein BroJett014_13430 [Planctomycetota bacterium]|nr:hypothetical protein [Planctomycetota bacterium]GIK52370.1 MAG: hypothetical protein BroJett014_13430 [Planctomycetota bacterium]
MALRYVILAHSVNGGVHFDLLLEVQGQERLRACQLEQRLAAAGESCPWRELEPHRRLYLSFEGEVSGDRGQVRRVEQGSYSQDGARLSLRPDEAEAYELELSEGQARRL